MTFRTVLLFGAPGSGKGTQGKILGTIPGFFHFACGDAFRNLRIDDPLGKVFIEYSSKGQLVPDKSTIELWKKNIQASTSNGSFHPERDMLVLDGIPRNPAQAEMLKSMLDVRAVFHLTCTDMTKMVERLQRRALRENRLDDAHLEVIRRRLEIYDQETKPVLEYYGSKLVHSVDSAASPMNVLRTILNDIAMLDEKQPKR
ncbi:MAG: nucleoside monophosphate kinase [Verrucomicrobia bacterium]|nr:nucleoside monophosphate kinase [Verrucomicrobiota bacterium]MBI3869940.1 nucleoside monophosphate kinase [Verrucomicrobiota bacterium]